MNLSNLWTLPLHFYPQIFSTLNSRRFGTPSGNFSTPSYEAMKSPSGPSCAFRCWRWRVPHHLELGSGGCLDGMHLFSGARHSMTTVNTFRRSCAILSISRIFVGQRFLVAGRRSGRQECRPTIQPVARPFRLRFSGTRAVAPRTTRRSPLPRRQIINSATILLSSESTARRADRQFRFGR